MAPPNAEPRKSVLGVLISGVHSKLNWSALRVTSTLIRALRVTSIGNLHIKGNLHTIPELTGLEHHTQTSETPMHSLHVEATSQSTSPAR